MASSADDKYELITRRLQEVLGGDSIKAILAEGRTPKCYWGKRYRPLLILLPLIAFSCRRNGPYRSPYGISSAS